MANGRVTPYKPAREKAKLLSLWRTEVSRQFETLVQAQIQSAQGVTHMVARDAAGRWTTVTDPDVMVERLNAGEQAYRLSAVAPNATLIGQIMDRMFGQAKQTIDLDVSTEPSRLSDRELSASLGNLMKKLSPVSSPVVDVMPVEPDTDERNEISPQIDAQTDERNELSPVDDGLAVACVSPTTNDTSDTSDTNDTSETHGLRTVEEILAEARESAAQREREDEWPDV